MTYTNQDSYFEDFTVGDTYEHVRARTVSNTDNLWITHMSLNTAQAHFNLDHMSGLMDGIFSERLVMGAVTLAIVLGLTSEDMTENAIADIGLSEIRMPNPVYRGDTLYATSTVLALSASADRPDCGVLTYRFNGRKTDGTPVVSGIRRVLLKRRAQCQDRDDNLSM